MIALSVVVSPHLLNLEHRREFSRVVTFNRSCFILKKLALKTCAHKMKGFQDEDFKVLCFPRNEENHYSIID